MHLPHNKTAKAFQWISCVPMDNEEYVNYPEVVNSNNIVQWDSWNIPTVTPAVMIAQSLLVVLIAWIFKGIVTDRNTPRSLIKSYSVHFPLSLSMDIMLLAMCVLLKKDQNMDIIFPFLNFALVYRCYEKELSFLFRLIIIGCREGFAVFRMWSIRKTCILIVLVLFFSIYLPISLIVCSYLIRFVLYAIQYLTADYLFSIHSCVFNEHYKTFQYNRTFSNVNHEVYTVNNTVKSGFSFYSKFETTHNISFNIGKYYEEITVSIHEDVTIQCSFTISPYEKYSPPFPLIWKYEGKDITNSHKYDIKTRIRPLIKSSAMKYLIDSTLTIYSTEEENFGEYSCNGRVVNICSNGLSNNVCSYVDVKSAVVKRFFIKQKEKPPMKIIHVPVGNTIFITWCNVAINNFEDKDFFLYHTVNGRTIDFNGAENDKYCSFSSWFLHEWSYFFGWVRVQPPNKFRGVYVSRNSGYLAFVLHTCATKEIYGLHKMILIREFFNTTSQSNVLLEVERAQDILIVPEVPYTRGNMFDDLQSDVYSSYRLSNNDIVVYYLRIVLEYTVMLFYAHNIYMMELIPFCFWCTIEAIFLYNYTLDEPKIQQIKSQAYDVAILCGEDD